MFRRACARAWGGILYGGGCRMFVLHGSPVGGSALNVRAARLGKASNEAFLNKHETPSFAPHSLRCAHTCSRISNIPKGESKDEGSVSNATAGLNLLATLLGAPAKDDAWDGEGDEGAGGAKRRGSRRDSFKINLFPDDPFDAAAQAKGGDDDVRMFVCRRAMRTYVPKHPQPTLHVSRARHPYYVICT